MTALGFGFPFWLILLILVPMLAAWRWWLLKKGSRALPYPTAPILTGHSGRGRWYPWVAPVLSLAALAALILALARPYRTLGRTEVTTEGVAIMICMDISGSMRAEDFQPSNRMDVARGVVADFIKLRTEDRLGLVTFAGIPLLRCPLTRDHETLLEIVQSMKTVSRTELDGTAIGDALVGAGKRLIHAPETSKVVILVTDGDNNRGQIDPIQAAELLGLQPIRVHVVGIGSTGPVPYPIPGPSGKVSYQYVKIGFDEEALERIAGKADGVYYNAIDAEGLERVFSAIDELERSKVVSEGYVKREELFLFPLWIGSLFLVFLYLWRYGPGRSLP